MSTFWLVKRSRFFFFWAAAVALSGLPAGISFCRPKQMIFYFSGGAVFSSLSFLFCSFVFGFGRVFWLIKFKSILPTTTGVLSIEAKSILNISSSSSIKSSSSSISTFGWGFSIGFSSWICFAGSFLVNTSLGFAGFWGSGCLSSVFTFAGSTGFSTVGIDGWAFSFWTDDSVSVFQWLYFFLHPCVQLSLQQDFPQPELQVSLVRVLVRVLVRLVCVRKVC